MILNAVLGGDVAYIEFVYKSHILDVFRDIFCVFCKKLIYVQSYSRQISCGWLGKINFRWTLNVAWGVVLFVEYCLFNLWEVL